MFDKIELVGQLEFYLNDELIQTVRNTVVTAGKNHVADVLGNGSVYSGKYIQVGTGTAPAAVGDTNLQTPKGTRELGLLSATGNLVRLEAVMSVGNPSTSEALTEAGIFSASSGGFMIARTVFPVVNKASDDTLRIIWTIAVG